MKGKDNLDERNVAALDKGLSDEQRREWNAIYASYRSESLLTARVAGMDQTVVTVRNEETGRPERRGIPCLVIIGYRVKVLIPESEVWFNQSAKRPPHVLRSMAGATIDYVITGIDREAECCIASRRMALAIRRRAFLRTHPETGQKVSICILAVGRQHMLVTCGGFDMTLSPRDISYAMIPELRERYHPGEACNAVITRYNPGTEKLAVSIKAAEPHPFDGIDARHPVGCRRASVITGKYHGGVFCKLEDNLDCLCTYSPEQYDEDFHIGDPVIIVITKYAYDKKQVYGKIVSKW